MKPTTGGRNRWLQPLGAAVLAVTTSGCSGLIAHSGIANVAEIDKPETRAEVRAAFGGADETGICPDGRIVELRSIRQQVQWVCAGQLGSPPGGRCDALGRAYIGTLGLADVFVIPFIAYRSEKAKLHYVFVYGADGRVLSRYPAYVLPSDLCPLELLTVP
jgi:hypothetical protein